MPGHHIRRCAIAIVLTSAACADRPLPQDAGQPADAGPVDAAPPPLDPLPIEAMTVEPLGAVTLPTATITWSQCPLFRPGDPSGDPNRLAECARHRLPTYYDGAEDTFEVALSRTLGRGSADRQLWLVSGGPGASATALFPGFLAFFQDNAPNFDVYTMDQRGTGGSERLACPAQESPDSLYGNFIDLSELPDCAAHLRETVGTRLRAYATTYAAIDLAAAIEAERRPGQQVFVWGSSYGTIVVQRYLQLFPNQADGVILMAINPPDASMIDFLDGFDEVGRKLLDEVCTGDPACAARFSGSPLATYRDAMERLDTEGHCPELTQQIDRSQLRNVFAQALGRERFMALVPAMTHRLARCTGDDAAVLARFATTVLSQGGLLYEDPRLWADALKYHVEMSEMFYNSTYPDAGAAADFVGARAQQLYYDVSPTILEMQRIWAPIAYHDPTYGNGWAETDVPMMMFQGGLDPQTRRSRADLVGAHFDGAHQTYVVFDHATHAFERATRYSAGIGNVRDCYFDLWYLFMIDPTGTPDLRCVDETNAIDFFPRASDYEDWLGTTDAWGD